MNDTRVCAATATHACGHLVRHVIYGQDQAGADETALERASRPCPECAGTGTVNPQTGNIASGTFAPEEV